MCLSALLPHSNLVLSYQSYFLNFKNQAMVLFWAGSSRVGEDGRKQSVCADGMVTVAPNQEIIAWAEEGFGLDVTFPCISVRLAYVGAWPADGRCWAGRMSQPCQCLAALSLCPESWPCGQWHYSPFWPAACSCAHWQLISEGRAVGTKRGSFGRLLAQTDGFLLDPWMSK